MPNRLRPTFFRAITCRVGAKAEVARVHDTQRQVYCQEDCSLLAGSNT